MKALVYTAPNEVVYRDEPTPVRGDGEVMIRIDAVGICGSDMHAYHGHDPRRKPPLVLGHELCGEIVEGVGHGRRVTVNPLITCGRCDYCVEGRNNLCSNRSMIGMTRPGGFAQFMTIPASCVIDLPAAMSTRIAALTEPAATVVHAMALGSRVSARPLPESRVLIIGAGAIGLLSAFLLRSYGVRAMRVAETNALRRAAAERAGGFDVFDPRDESASGDEYHLVIDAVGAKSTRDTALAAIRPGGVIVHIGLADWTSMIDMRKLTLAEVCLIGAYTYSTADLRAAVRGLHDGQFGDLAWVEERPLAEGARAFLDLHEGRAAAKVLLRPS